MKDKITMFFLTRYYIKFSLVAVFISMCLIILASFIESNILTTLSIICYLIGLYLIHMSQLYYSTDEYSHIKLKYILDNLGTSSIVKNEDDSYISISHNLFELSYYKETSKVFCKTDSRYAFDYLSEEDSFKLLKTLKMMDESIIL